MPVRKKQRSILWKKSYMWVTLAFFALSVAGHWAFGWAEYKKEQEDHHQPVEVSGYTVQMLRDTFENWQWEFLQLIWQVAGLAFLLYVGSPASKESDERIEEKLDYLIKTLDPKKAEELLKSLENKYPKE